MTSSTTYRVDWHPADAPATFEAASFASHYPVRLADGCRLVLPLVPLPGGEMAIALLMSNQTDFSVERNIVARLAAMALAAAPQAVVGIPTLGLTYARPVAEAVGSSDFVALGHSRKFWYDDGLSEAVVSSTSPDHSKRIYLDPALVERIRGKRIVIVDDVLNTGNTMVSAIKLLRKADVHIAAMVVALTEGWDWHRSLSALDPQLPVLVQALGHIPLFRRNGARWEPLPGTDAGVSV